MEARFEQKYGVTMGEVEDLISDLLGCGITQRKDLTGETYQVFGRQAPDNPGVWAALIRRRYDSAGG